MIRGRAGIFGRVECFCGCGRAIRPSQLEANLRLTETALDLLAWDRYRTTSALDRPEAFEIGRLVDAGARCHQRLLAAVHRGDEEPSVEEADAWLRDSRAGWSSRPSMTEKGSLLRGRALRLEEDDIARLDRAHPERSFSATPGPGPAPTTGDEDLVAQLERLGAMRESGLLNDSEFQLAKKRLLRGERSR